MKKKRLIQDICFWILFAGISLIIGIVGGVDNGQPIHNMLWTVPIFAVLFVTVIIGQLLGG